MGGPISKTGVCKGATIMLDKPAPWGATMREAFENNTSCERIDPLPRNRITSCSGKFCRRASSTCAKRGFQTAERPRPGTLTRMLRGYARVPKALRSYGGIKAIEKSHGCANSHPLLWASGPSSRCAQFFSLERRTLQAHFDSSSSPERVSSLLLRMLRD